MEKSFQEFMLIDRNQLREDPSRAMYSMIYSVASKMMSIRDLKIFSIESLLRYLNILSAEFVNFYIENNFDYKKILNYNGFEEFKNFLIQYVLDNSYKYMLNCVGNNDVKKSVIDYIEVVVFRKLSKVLDKDVFSLEEVTSILKKDKKLKKKLVEEVIDRYLILSLLFNENVKVICVGANHFFNIFSEVGYFSLLKFKSLNVLSDYSLKSSFYFVVSSLAVGVYLSLVYNIFYFFRILEILQLLKSEYMIREEFSKMKRSIEVVENFRKNNFDRFVGDLDLFFDLKDIRKEVKNISKRMYSSLVESGLDYRSSILSLKGLDSRILKKIEFEVMFGSEKFFSYLEEVDFLIDFLKFAILEEIRDYKIVFESVQQVLEDYLNDNMFSFVLDNYLNMYSSIFSENKNIVSVCIFAQKRVFSSLILFFLFKVLNALTSELNKN